ncbi:DUF6634 family protein [Methylobacterium gnaphalii]|uniref:Uncharacterized protein n=1 Tax=Methylobacterium gnaphalii TaxID=1010610 RepID=A0A512JR58_9HYPH|nr:DUF6634 family protein [Methylobacterium gnaphalii]GEP12458.1 hypothetical protein MGN01_43030 [Methylobacterium gnaphalii]GJD71530.1 hypothetical protein MMMDOFMJ_4491 [Methylobacterium gnaphalii]GLS49788.1 hypothetical protein GCM10007885_26390 [Methylobacterium gnaphalii]
MTSSGLELILTTDEAARLDSALKAYDHLSGGDPPDPRALAAAPLLRDWQCALVPTMVPVLAGEVRNHPALPGTRRVATSRLLLLDAGAGWARTLSRLYRLGPAAR